MWNEWLKSMSFQTGMRGKTKMWDKNVDSSNP